MPENDASSAKIDQLCEAVYELRKDVTEVKEILETWRAMKLMARWAKYVVTFMAAAGAAYATAKDWWWRK